MGLAMPNSWMIMICWLQVTFHSMVFLEAAGADRYLSFPFLDCYVALFLFGYFGLNSHLIFLLTPPT